MKIISSVLFGLTIIFAKVGYAAPSSSPPTVKLVATYSETANIFDIMDNVSNWWEGFCEQEYQKYWVKAFGLSQKDQDLFARYKNFRQRYYSDPDQAEKDPAKNRNGFFATAGAITADPVAEVFYSANTMEEAFQRLSGIVKPDDVSFLREFYSAFSERYLTLLQESFKFADVAKDVSAQLADPRIVPFFEKVAKFYRVGATIDYRVLYVWWPPIKRTNASPTGRFLIMRYNPIKHLKDAKADSEIVFHEVVHTISARQDLAQKQTLTKEFVSVCSPYPSIKKLNILEEPLAVALGQMIFLENIDPKRFDYMSNWYSERWTTLFSKLILPVVRTEFEAGRTLTDGVIPKSAKLCKEVMTVAGKLEKKTL